MSAIFMTTIELRQLRISKGLTLKAAAEMVGLSACWLHQMEMGKGGVNEKGAATRDRVVSLLSLLPNKPEVEFKKREHRGPRMMRRIDRRPSPTELYQWFVRDNLTAKQIGEKIGFGERTVQGWLADYGIYKTAPKQDWEFCKTCGHMLTEKSPVHARIKRH